MMLCVHLVVGIFPFIQCLHDSIQFEMMQDAGSEVQCTTFLLNTGKKRIQPDGKWGNMGGLLSLALL